VRVKRRWGPARIGFLLGLHPSTVHKVLARYGLARLTWLDRSTGQVIRRYEHKKPGDLVHVDIKKLGRIPDGGGHRVLGRAAGIRVKKGAKPGYAYLHHAVDDHSRLVYSEILNDERKESAAAFWTRANAYFNSCGITVLRVLTDNGPCYRSKAFTKALGVIAHKRTRPYRPQTNGKVERFNRTLLEEWAYARVYASESQRVATYAEFIHNYNHHRGHTALGGKSPADRVPNLRGQYT
jgi:transposase InsO family protein